MSNRISILSENLTNKIAAGEVVERPSSVIKELIENCLDAGATDVFIEIASGGRRRIKVSDNGCGMSREDALLSLERHATSKIRVDADLELINTLGFRGEALPSIASVSRFSLATRETGSPEGVEITVEGGRMRDVKACGMAPGTTIIVEQLFFNLPARLKFLKNPETEAGHAADAVSRMAVSRPDVSFTCVSDGRELFKLKRGDLLERLTGIVGRESARHLHRIESNLDGVSLSGYVSAPSLVRSGIQSIYTYVNGRFVRDKVVQHALMQAYRGVIDRGRYPVVALFIELPPQDLDVNVHPTKHEVRFRRQTAVHDAIRNGIEELLSRSPWLASPRSRIVPLSAPSEESLPGSIKAALQESLSLRRNPADYRNSDLYSRGPLPHLTRSPQGSVADSPPPFKPDHEEAGSGGYFSSLSVIGQFHGEYILCQSDKELVIIDQHAASERVAFQILKQQFNDSKIESQRLLFPETVELTFREAEVATRYCADLTRVGFEIEPFGGSTVIVSGVPRLVATQRPLELIRDLLAELEQFGTSTAFENLLENLLSRIACHSVIRGVHPLDRRQITELLQQMDSTGFAASCPHGRPVSHLLSLSELQKIFKRT